VKKSNNSNTRDVLTEEIFAQIKDRVKYGLDKFQTTFWLNPRPKDEGGYRLSEFGYAVLKELDYKDYPIDLPKDVMLTAQTTIWMDRYLDGPWFLDNKTLHCFKEKTAFQLILFSGDVSKFGWSMDQSKKL